MVYGYVRVSTDKQTTENQRFEIEKFTKSRNMRIDRWVDETISGTKVIADRQLGKLLKQIRKGDILITTELSRLGRNLMLSLIHISEDYSISQQDTGSKPAPLEGISQDSSGNSTEMEKNTEGLTTQAIINVC